MSIGYDWFTDTLQAQISLMETNLKWINDNCEGVVTALYWVSPQFLLPPTWPLRDRLIRATVAALREAVKSAQEVVQQFRDAVDSLGSPDALREAGEEWTQNVAKSVDDMSALFIKETFASALPSNWSGEAADVYRGAIGMQKTAADKVAVVAKGIREGLDGAASALETFFLAIVAAALSFVAAIITCIGLICALVTAPASPVPLITGAITAAGAFVAGLIAVNVMMQTQATAFRTLETQTSIETWPSPVFS